MSRGGQVNAPVLYTSMSTIEKKHKPRDSKPNEGNEPPNKKKKAGDAPETSTVKPS